MSLHLWKGGFRPARGFVFGRIVNCFGNEAAQAGARNTGLGLTTRTPVEERLMAGLHAKPRDKREQERMRAFENLIHTNDNDDIDCWQSIGEVAAALVEDLIAKREVRG